MSETTFEFLNHARFTLYYVRAGCMPGRVCSMNFNSTECLLLITSDLYYIFGFSEYTTMLYSIISYLYVYNLISETCQVLLLLNLHT